MKTQKFAAQEAEQGNETATTPPSLQYCVSVLFYKKDKTQENMKKNNH